MELTRRPHDKFFKAMMFDLLVAKDFFAAYLPKDILSQVDLNSLRLEQNILINSELVERQTDILYKVNLKSSEKESLFLLVEHLSATTPMMAFRTPNYVMRILDRYINEAIRAKINPLPLPVVFPLVFYNGERSYRGECYLHNLFSDYGQKRIEKILSGPLNIKDISLESNVDLGGQQWASLLSWCMRYSAQREFLPYIQDFGRFIRDIIEVSGWGDADRIRMEIMLNYIMASLNSSADSNTLIRALLNELPAEVEETVMTLAEQLIAKGKIEGRIEGEIKGKMEGIEETLAAITLIKEGADDAMIMQQTRLSLETIQTLRKKILH